MIRARAKASMILGLAALIVVLAMLTAAVLETSLHSYHTSAQAQWRLKARAAAEGAALLVAADPNARRDAVLIGATRVEFGEARLDEAEASVPLNAVVLSPSELPILEIQFVAHLTASPAGTWSVRNLERVP